MVVSGVVVCYEAGMLDMRDFQIMSPLFLFFGVLISGGFFFLF